MSSRMSHIVSSYDRRVSNSQAMVGDCVMMMGNCLTANLNYSHCDATALLAGLELEVQHILSVL